MGEKQLELSPFFISFNTPDKKNTSKKKKRSNNKKQEYVSAFKPLMLEELGAQLVRGERVSAQAGVGFGVTATEPASGGAVGMGAEGGKCGVASV